MKKIPTFTPLHQVALNAAKAYALTNAEGLLCFRNLDPLAKEAGVNQVHLRQLCNLGYLVWSSNCARGCYYTVAKEK